MENVKDLSMKDLGDKHTLDSVDTSHKNERKQ